MTELAYIEFRSDGEGRELRGPAVVYGDEARIGPRMRERFEPGAFAELPADATLTIQHDRAAIVARLGVGLTLADSPGALEMRAELPDTPRATQALADVRAGLLRGLSVEFVALRERYQGALRIIERARLIGISIVDDPAYPASTVEAREARLDGEALGGLPGARRRAMRALI